MAEVRSRLYLDVVSLAAMRPPDDTRSSSSWREAVGILAGQELAGQNRPTDYAPALPLLESSTSQTIVFINNTEYRTGPWRTQGLRTGGTPFGLGALSAGVLLTPAVYRAYGAKLRWRRPVSRYS